MLKKILKKVLKAFGFSISRLPKETKKKSPYPYDFSKKDIFVLKRIHDFTMTSLTNRKVLLNSVRYLVKEKIKGCLVECGVWRGGSSMAMAYALIQEGDKHRNLYLYDTFCGMTPPTKDDKSVDNVLAQTLLKKDKTKQKIWCISSLDEVKKNLKSTKYPYDKIHFIEGPVEKTLKKEIPKEPIALLRLDTDWYKSTKQELEKLYPLIVSGGVLIIDDYGCWSGSRKATDEFFKKTKNKVFLHRIDETARIYIKP